MTMFAPVLTSPSRFLHAFLTAGMTESRATPPPGTMPSSTAARVAARASSMRKFGNAFLQFLSVVVGSGLCDLRADGCHSRFDGVGIARAADDGGVLLADLDGFRGAQHVDRDGFEVIAEVACDIGAAREDGDVLKICLSPVAEAGGFDRHAVEHAFQLVDDDGGESLALRF